MKGKGQLTSNPFDDDDNEWRVFAADWILSKKGQGQGGEKGNTEFPKRKADSFDLVPLRASQYSKAVKNRVYCISNSEAKHAPIQRVLAYK